MANFSNPLYTTLMYVLQRAGNNALGRQSRVKPEEKGHRDTVTQVDRQNELMIRDALLRFDPKISFLGEETEAHNGSGKLLAVVDPLDATTNYTLQRREFSIMGAIFESKEPRFGAIYIPAFHEMFTAEVGTGAFLNGNPIHASDIDTLKNAVISCNRSNYPSEESAEFDLALIRALTKYAKSWRNLGTAGCEYTDVACGKLHGIITPIAESVHAAGYIIMQEAGAKVTDQNGNALSLDSKIIVAANPNIHEVLLELVRDVMVTGPSQ